MVGEMSCEYCKGCNGKLIHGGDGYFTISKCAHRRHDGSKEEFPILEYTASDSVFSCDVEIEDYTQINYCPMCGSDLTGEL